MSSSSSSSKASKDTTPPGTPELKNDEKKETPRSTGSGKKRQRKEPAQHAAPAHTMETRTRKKAREAIDLVTDAPQRKESLLNLLGSDYEAEAYHGPSEEQLKMMFRVFDRDNDGRIGSDELASVMRSMGRRPLTKKIQKMLDECDANKTGSIELDGFVKYMQKKAAKKAEGLRKEKEKEKGKEKEKEKEKGKEKEKEAEVKSPPTKAKKGKGAAATAAASPKASAAKSKGKGKAAETTTSAVKRGSSLIDFYNPHAGLQEVPTNALDKHNNPVGAHFDLGVEGAFTQYSILVGMFYDPSHDGAATTMDLKDFNARVGGSMKTKGFHFTTVTTQKEFVSKLAEHDIAWVVSGTDLDKSTTSDEFADAVAKFHTQGGGLFVWGDNSPFFEHANLVLQKLYNVQLQGNTPAQKVLSAGSGSQSGQFEKHLITSGIKHLFEGRTVSYPASVPQGLNVLATSTDNHPVILYSGAGAQHEGRVVVDCGFTKLWVEWDSAGTERYVKNANVWLLGLENRIASDAPLIGKLVVPVKEKKPSWQYKHGTWHDYDKEASDTVEEAYQDWVKNPYVDVRSVKSGVWHYQVDFKQMVQTNIQHQNHTQREVRRVEKDA